MRLFFLFFIYYLISVKTPANSSVGRAADCSGIADCYQRVVCSIHTWRKYSYQSEIDKNNIF